MAEEVAVEDELSELVLRQQLAGLGQHKRRELGADRRLHRQRESVCVCVGGGNAHAASQKFCRCINQKNMHIYFNIIK